MDASSVSERARRGHARAAARARARSSKAAAAAYTSPNDGFAMLGEDVSRIIARLLPPAENGSLRQTASGNRAWPDSCDIGSTNNEAAAAAAAALPEGWQQHADTSGKSYYVSPAGKAQWHLPPPSGCSAYDKRYHTFYIGGGDVGLNKAALLQVLADDYLVDDPGVLTVTNVKEPWLNLPGWTEICKTPWFKCVFEPIKIMEADKLSDKVDPLCAMIKSGSLANLKLLWLDDQPLGDAGMTAFAGAIASGSMANLQALLLDDNQIGGPGMTALANAIANGSLGNLKQLHLDGNEIGDPGVSALAGAIASGSMANLRFLRLDSNEIGDTGMSALAGAIASGSLLSLQTLYVDKTNLEYGSLGTEHPQLKAACEARGISVVRDTEYCV